MYELSVAQYIKQIIVGNLNCDVFPWHADFSCATFQYLPSFVTLSGLIISLSSVHVHYSVFLMYLKLTACFYEKLFYSCFICFIAFDYLNISISTNNL